jgi:3-oxoadipate enol-lactonase
MRAQVDGAELEYEVSGSGPWLTLAHALGADLSLWDGLATRLADRCTVLRFDARGHGRSSLGNAPVSMRSLAADAAALLDHVGADETVWVGLSLGGMVGQHLALDHPDRVGALVLADTTAGYPAATHPTWRERQASVRASGMAAVADGTLGRWLTEPFRKAHPDETERVRRMLLAAPPEGYARAVDAIVGHDTLARLGEIRCPTLVLVGEKDEATPPSHSELLRDEVAGATLHVVPDAAHIVPVERPETFERLVREFLDALPAETRA